MTYIITVVASSVFNGDVDHFRTVRVMILIRFAISIFALALLGLALSLSSAQSEQDNPVDVAVVTAR
ncbi:hypothetical protein DW352_05970 [Pseudolabrys taiwanensis]|uniref:Uncharacterized protein n=1 Tax=Pseudolabrys taiwanensis TaxID=331696 RepID=A0A345ZT55_9HYPH|nr:hypothetical protein DW352_05970 [Pseudolabrys taiwanensis]